MDSHNYCGGSKKQTWWHRLLSKKFNQACFKHDVDYIETKMTRFQADRKFLLQMLRVADTKQLVGWAIVYYIAVRLFGWIYWGK